jgi:hypothetical protein
MQLCRLSGPRGSAIEFFEDGYVRCVTVTMRHITSETNRIEGTCRRRDTQAASRHVTMRAYRVDTSPSRYCHKTNNVP